MEKHLARDYDFLIKIVIIGDAGVGKSSFLVKYIDENFEDNYTATVGVDFKIKSLKIDDKLVKLQVWDTAGQERFKPITKCYFRGSHGCVILYDITSKATFNNVRSWVHDFREDNVLDAIDNIIVVGNKADVDERRQVSFEEGSDLAEALNARFMEASAKSGEGVCEVFGMLVQIVMENMDHKRLSLTKDFSLFTRSDMDSDVKRKRKCCMR